MERVASAEKYVNQDLSGAFIYASSLKAPGEAYAADSFPFDSAVNMAAAKRFSTRRWKLGGNIPLGTALPVLIHIEPDTVLYDAGHIVHAFLPGVAGRCLLIDDFNDFILFH